MSTAQFIVAFFEGKGLTKAQAAGIAGNTMQESADNPNAPGGGLIQGQGGRTSSGSLNQQLESVWRELLGPERATLTLLRQAQTPEESARIFSQRFERPGVPMLANRERYAREAFGGGGGGPAAGTGGSSSSTSPSSPSSSSSSKLPGGLVGVATKALLYLALIGGALGALWIGAKTFLQPKPKAAAA